MHSVYSQLLLFLQLLSTLSLNVPSSLQEAPDHSLVAREDSPKRNVWIVSDVVIGAPEVLPDGATVYFMHASLFIEGNDDDGPIVMEYSVDDQIATTEDEKGLYLRILDMGTGASGKQMKPSTARKAIKAGQIEKRNVDLFDPEKSSGLITDAWLEDPSYQVGASETPEEIKDCNTLIKRLLTNLGLSVPEEANKILTMSDKWQSRPNQQKFTANMQSVSHSKLGGDGKGSYQTFTAQKADTSSCKTCKRNGKNTKNTQGSKGKCKKSKLGKGKDNKGSSKPKNELALDQKKAKQLPKELLDIVSDQAISGKAPTNGKAIVPVVKEGGSTIARSGGTLKTFSAISKASFEALGIAGTIVGAVFVILDLVDEDWVGAALGAIGLAAGVSTGLAVSGPLGWIVGAAVTAFFSILPGLFNGPKLPAKLEDMQGILQWKMFGDPTTTGNEKCQKGTDGVPGNSECQALYGAGTIAKVLEMSNFDTLLFMIHYNDGYPMTIPDMATAFKSDDGVSSFDCDNKKATQGIMGGSGYVGDDGTRCNNPSFKIDASKVHLPDLDTTGDKIKDRIIPKAKGDCKLISYPGKETVPDLDLTVSGKASAIACGLKADTKVGGSVLSTDGNPGSVYVPPPPKKAFAKLSPEEYPCISIGDEEPFCLPPGKYKGQGGLGFESSKVDTLTLPKKWSLRTHWKGKVFSDPDKPDDPTGPTKPDPLPANPHHHYRRGQSAGGVVQNDYDKNQSPKASTKNGMNAFAEDMKSIFLNTDDEGWFEVRGPDDGPRPVCCLFSETSYNGNAWCIGVGGGNVLPQWKDVAKSIKCLGNAQAWIYADSYGDTGGALVTGSLEDLKQEPYGGEKETFSERVKAWWISEIKSVTNSTST